MTFYTFHDNPEPDTPAFTEPVSTADVRSYVRELSGRDVLGYPSVRKSLDRKGSVYVACNRDAPYEGRGFIVRKVSE